MSLLAANAASPTRASLLRRQVFVVTWLSYFGFYFCRKAWSVVKADVQRELSFSTAEIANIGTIFLVTYMLGQFASGAAGRRFGAKRLLLAGMALSIGANVAFGFGSTYGAFASFMALNGFAQSAGWPGNIGILSQWYRREERGTVLGWWSTCYSMGSAAAKGFAGTIVALAIFYHLPSSTWRYAFWASSLVMVAIWLLFLRFAHDRPEDAGEAEIVQDDAPTEAVASTPWQAYLQVLRNPVVLMVGGTYFCFKFLRYAIDSWAPYIFRNMGMTTQESAWASTAFDWAGIVGVILAGFASDRLFAGRRSLVCLISTVGMGMALIAGYYAVSAAMIILCFALVGFTLYGPDSLMSGAGAADVANDKAGAVAAAGIINGIGSLGPIVQEQVVPMLLSYDNPMLAVAGAQGALKLQSMNLLFVALGGLGVAALLYLYWRGRRSPQHAF